MKTNTYHLWIKTGDQPLGGTDSNVFIQLFGTDGKTESIYLPPQEIFAFEQGNIDRFVQEVPDLGELTRCCIGQDASADSGWFVETVRVKDDDTDREWLFPFNRWLGIEEAGSLSACIEC
ncbi:MAG: PLAT/LH2 domain-containing protein [Anaerolineae bacterium]